MKNKDISAIAGVNGCYIEILKNKGYEKTYHLIGQFLILHQDKVIFETWLESTFGYNNSKWRCDISNCLIEWCDNHL